jgi:hypothetical protein
MKQEDDLLHQFCFPLKSYHNFKRTMDARNHFLYRFCCIQCEEKVALEKPMLGLIHHIELSEQ